MNKNLIIVYYPSGASGRFLISSLCFGNNCSFPFGLDNLYTKKLTQEKKYDLITKRLQENNLHWNDFGIDEPEHQLHVRKFNFNQSWEQWLSDRIPLVTDDALNCFWEPTIKTNNYVFKSVDSIQRLYVNKMRYPDAKIVYFTNNYSYLQSYRKKYVSRYLQKLDTVFKINRKLLKQWDTIKGKDWPSMPTSESELKALEPFVLEELEALEDYNKYLTLAKLNDFYHSLVDNPNVYFWNTMHLADLTLYLDSLDKVYRQFGLTNYNAKLLEKFYTTYHGVLKTVKVNSEQPTVQELAQLKVLNDPKSMRNRLMQFDIKKYFSG